MQKDAEANDMIHMGIDHRCVMATFMIITPNKSSCCKTKGKLDTTKIEGRDKTDNNIGVEKKIKENTADTKQAAAQTRSEHAEAQAQNDSAVADGVDATGETRQGHLGFSTVTEEAGHSAHCSVLRVEQPIRQGRENDDYQHK